MTTYAIIQGGLVSNTAVADAPLANNWVLMPEGAGIGWLYDGEKFSAPVVPPTPEPVPDRCTRRQGLLALLANGITPSQVQALIDAISSETDRIAAQIEYEANDWERDNPVVQQMWSSLGGTSAQLDDLYRLAVTL